MGWGEALKEARKLSREEFDEKMRQPDARNVGLKAERIELLYRLVKGDLSLHAYSHQPDIDAFSIKLLYPETYKELPNIDSPYADGELYEYDPAKNGQNMVKHGLSFGEVATYSNHFGLRMVGFPDPSDGERLALFSDLDLRPKHNKLALPPGGVRPLNVVMSFVHQRDGKFRFISSRLLSLTEENCRADIDRIIKKSISDTNARKPFVDRSLAHVKEWLVDPALSVEDCKS